MNLCAIILVGSIWVDPCNVVALYPHASYGSRDKCKIVLANREWSTSSISCEDASAAINAARTLGGDQ